MKALFEALEKQKVGDGDLQGEPFKVLQYQKKFLTGAFKDGVFLAGLTLGRGGGKTGLLTALAADVVSPDGHLHKPGFETILIASSFRQAEIGAEPLLYVLECGKGDRNADLYHVKNSQGIFSITNKESKARLRICGSDNRRAHGWRPNLVLADEPAQWGPSGERLNAAIVTSLGKRRGAKVLYFGTRPRDPDHFFAKLLKDTDPSVFTLEYAADEKDKWDSVKTWNKANPAMKYGLPDKEVLKAEARRAKHDPGLLASFKALRLNMGISETDDRDMLIAPEVWRGLLERTPPAPEGDPVWGVDLGGSAAFSSVTSCWGNGRLENLNMCGSIPNLEKRSLQDGAGELYHVAHKAGELILSQKRIPDLNQLFTIALERFGAPSAIVCDRYRIKELEDALDADTLRALRGVEIVTRGQGYKDGSEAVRAFKSAAVTQSIYPVKPCSLLTAGMAEAVVLSDPAGNEKLAKNTEGGRRKRARDDAVAATLLAVEFGLKRKANTFSWGVIGRG